MHNERKHIDDLFRKGLNGLREKPPVHAWNRLEEGLGALGSVKRLRFLRLAAASILILLAFGAGYYYAIYNTTQNREGLTTNDQGPAGVSEQQIIEPKQSKEKRVPESITPQKNTAAYKDPASGSPSSNPDKPFKTTEETSAMILAEKDLEPSSTAPLATTVHFGVQKIEFVNIGSLPFSQPNKPVAITGMEMKPKNSLEPYPVYNYPDAGEKPKKYQYKWAVGAQFAPTYSYRDISTTYGASAAGNTTTDDAFDAIEDPLLSYAGGLQVDYRVSGNWRLESGVYFSRIGQVNNDALQFKQNNSELILTGINTSTGGIDVAYERVPENVKRINSPKDTIDLGGVENARIVQQFDLFEIPFLVKYKMLNRKFSMHIAGGLSPAYLVDNNTYLELEDRKYDVGDAGNLNNMIVNTSLGLGFEYLITKTLSVNLEPTFKYALNPLNNNSSFSYHPYYFSWFTGIRLRID